MENGEEGCAHAIHNAEVMKVGEEVMANLKQACADLKADAANDQTTLAEREMCIRDSVILGFLLARRREGCPGGRLPCRAWLRAVSYTHLDVYKRQRMCWIRT